MYKSGCVVGAITFFLALGITLVLPFCVPCLALLVGLGAGYLAGVIDKPNLRPVALKNGTIAGAISGAGALIGELTGAVINGFLVGPENAMQIVRSIGLPAIPTMTPELYWISNIGINFCIGLFSVAVMAGLGLLGGMLWWSSHASKATIPPPELN